MGILDVSPSLQELALQPHPNEGSHLPGYWELHSQEFIQMGIAVAIIAGLCAIGYALWRGRGIFIADRAPPATASEIIEYHDCGHAPPVITVRKP